MDYSPWGHKESDTTEGTAHTHMLLLAHKCSPFVITFFNKKDTFFRLGLPSEPGFLVSDGLGDLNGGREVSSATLYGISTLAPRSLGTEVPDVPSTACPADDSEQFSLTDC